jgi:hypothetical protein
MAAPGAEDYTGLLLRRRLDAEYAAQLQRGRPLQSPGPRCINWVEQNQLGGSLAIDQLRRLLADSIVSTPAVDRAVAMRRRGGAFRLEVGHEFSIGYLDRTDTLVRLLRQERSILRAPSSESVVDLGCAQCNAKQ